MTETFLDGTANANEDLADAPEDRQYDLDTAEESADPTSLAMFEGDSSKLYPEQRRCLHALLKYRYISAERFPEHWSVLLESSVIVESRLNELFFRLRLDRKNQVAFKYPTVADTGEPLPTLLRDVSHTKEETIVMVSLRRRFHAQRQEGDDIVFIDRQTLLDEVADQRPEQSTHRAMDVKRADKAIDDLAKAGVLLRTPDTDRFRVSPIIEVLMPVEKLRSLWTWLMTQNGTDAEAAPDTTEEYDLFSGLDEEDDA